MKYFYIILPALILTGCIKKSYVEFEGKTPGIKNGVFIIKTVGDSTIYGENIKDGKFTIAKKPLKIPGYYMANITNSDNNDNHEPFEIYLENGKYTFETEAGKLYKYPKITSPSKIQQQLSAFYALTDKLSLEAQKETDNLNAEIKTKGNSQSKNDFIASLNKLSAAKIKSLQNNVTAFTEFVKAYPQSDISTHLMAKLSYEDDPVSFYAIYKTLTPAAKNTDEGKEIGNRLSHLIKLIVGAKAPLIYGKTPGGKPFDQKSITKKTILIDFWRAGNEFSRRNHEKLNTLFNDEKTKGNFEIISVSLDSKPDWWTTAITEDHMTWQQISDLKGDDSPNAINWSITQIPTYYLLDNNWKIVESNIDIGNVVFEVNDYLKKHP
jgi:hypothetical protein